MVKDAPVRRKGAIGAKRNVSVVHPALAPAGQMTAQPARKPLAALALCLLAMSAVPAVAAEGPDEDSQSFRILRLESRSPITTWERGGVRVFVAPQGAQIRQGQVRLFAPRMVVWFEKAESTEPGVSRAIVRVYAEGRGPRGGAPRSPVRVVRHDLTESFGAVVTRFTSSFSFMWDAPLRRMEDPPPPSALLQRARALAEGAEQKNWQQIPRGPQVEVGEQITRRLSADHVEYFEEGEAAVYTGDVHGEYGKLQVRADAAVLWFDQQTGRYEVYAEGNVRVSSQLEPERPETEEPEDLNVQGLFRVAKADKLYTNSGRQRGLASNVELRASDPFAPRQVVYVLRGEEMFMIDSQTLSMKRASATTCNFVRPHYRIMADRLQIIRRRPSTLLNAWDVQLQVGESSRTLLWLPFVGTDLTQRSYLLEEYAFGSSDKFGTFLQTTWRPLDLMTEKPQWVERWALNLDYYTRRGPALGTELEYAFGDGYPSSEGRLRAYYVSDSADEDDNEQPVPKQDRGRFHLRHRTQLNRDWRLEGEFYWLSDDNFLNEYFEDDFENEKTPESYLLARYLRDSTYLALLHKRQVNDFITQLEEKPSADLQVVGVPLGRFVYEGAATAGLYELEPSDRLRRPDPPDLLRFHTAHSLSLPFMLGILRIDPSVRALATYAGESVEAGGFNGSETRTGLGAGVQASTTFSRVFGLNSELLDLNRLRHIVIPFVDVQSLTTGGAGSEDFIQMDRIDPIDTSTQTTIGLRQRLQTKRLRDERWESVDWMDLRVALVNRSSDSVDPELDEDFLRWDAEWRLTENIGIHSRDSRIGLDDLPDIINAGVNLNFLPDWSVALDYDRIVDTSSTVTARIFYQLSDRYQLRLTQQREFDSRGTGETEDLETIFVVRRLLDEWVLDMGFHYEKANDEMQFILGFGPAGFGVYQTPRRPGRL